jgi:hypothetical protein
MICFLKTSSKAIKHFFHFSSKRLSSLTICALPYRILYMSNTQNQNAVIVNFWKQKQFFLITRYIVFIVNW